jgi:hypothetical protein
MTSTISLHDFINHDIEDREDFSAIIKTLQGMYPSAVFKLRYNYVSDLTVIEFERNGVRYWASELAEDEASIYNTTAFRREGILTWLFKLKNIIYTEGHSSELFGIYTALPKYAEPREEFTSEDLPRLCNMLNDLGEENFENSFPEKVLAYIKKGLFRKLDQLANYTDQTEYLKVIIEYIDEKFTTDDLCLMFKDTPLQLSETETGAFHINQIGVIRAGFKRSIDIPYTDDDGIQTYLTHLPKSWEPSSKVMFMTDLYAMLRFVELRWQDEDPGEFVSIDFTYFAKYID